MNEQRAITIERVGIIVALLAAIGSPFWALSGQQQQQTDDHLLIQQISRDVRDVRERVARIEGNLDINPRENNR